MTREEASKIFLSRVTKEGYIADQKAKGINASGKSARSLTPEVNSTGGQILGSHYFAYQKIGRRPGGFPPIESIMQWIKDKGGFTYEGVYGLKGLAFAIARKIAKKGTDIHLGKRPGLSIEDKILDARKELALNLLKIEKERMTENLRNLRN